MFKSLLLISFIVALASASLDSIKSLKDIFDSMDDSPACQRESARFKDCFKDVEETTTPYKESGAFPTQEEIRDELPKVKKAIQCVGEVTCNKLILTMYIVESATYAMEKIALGGHDCFNERNLQSSTLICTLKEIPLEHIQFGDTSLISQSARPIARCVALEQNCDDVAKLEFLKGATAFADLSQVAMPTSFAVQGGDLTYIETFDKKFNPADYDNLQL
ncbi:hypothetical protein L5515_010289 [Caenorhabditis briggsae]|uniref:Uncharacterized protein n=1 Tax=Caenorhabditis briggsae TaxID=6238 RepID=A0AAE9ELQ1_CAEBR|nr:hypothetical protein L5515_010289 [Caenorhabditis briggsae]